MDKKNDDRLEKFKIAKFHYNTIMHFEKFYKTLLNEEKTALKYISNKENIEFIEHFIKTGEISSFYSSIPFINYNKIMSTLGYTLPKYQKISIENLKEYIEEFIKVQLDQTLFIDELFHNKHIPKFNGDIMFYNITTCQDLMGLKIGDIYLNTSYIFGSVYKSTSDKELNRAFDYNSRSKCMFILKNLKDIPCLFINNMKEDIPNISAKMDPAEYLLPRGMTIKITNITIHNSDFYHENYDKLAKIFHKDQHITDKGLTKYLIYTCEYVSRTTLGFINNYELTDKEKFSINLKPSTN